MKYILFIISILFLSLSYGDKIVLTNAESLVLKSIITDTTERIISQGKTTIFGYDTFNSADELIQKYKKISPWVNFDLNNKKIIISGVTKKIYTNTQIPEIHLKSNNVNYAVVLNFKVNHQQMLSQITKNQFVTFFCSGGRVINGSPILDNCQSLDIAKNNIKNEINQLFAVSLENPELASEEQKNIISSVKLISKSYNDVGNCIDIDPECFIKLSLSKIQDK